MRSIFQTVWEQGRKRGGEDWRLGLGVGKRKGRKEESVEGGRDEEMTGGGKEEWRIRRRGRGA
jgi:hypothetical protein